MCKHQVAWLLHEYASGDDAARLIIRMLGTRLGFAGGCTMEDISDLTIALLQLCMQPNATAAVQPDSTAQASEAAEASTATEYPGQRAMDNLGCRVRAEVEKQLALLHHVAPERRRVFMQAHVSGIMQLTRLLESAAGKPFEEYGNLSATNVSFKRHRHPLECNTVKRTPAPDKSTEAQADFPAQQPDNAKHISKGFANNRTARQAAAHVQQCLDLQRFPASGMCQGLQASAVAQPAVTQRRTPSVQSQPPPPLEPTIQQPPPEENVPSVHELGAYVRQQRA